MRFISIVFFMLFIQLNADEKYAQKGKGWETWQKFEKFVIAGQDKEAKSLLGFVFLSTINEKGLSRAQKEFKNRPAEFIREFKIQENIYLVIRDSRKILTILVAPKGNEWSLNLVIPEELKGPEDEEKLKEILKASEVARQKVKLVKIKSKLKQIGAIARIYFSFPETKNTLIPSSDDMDIDESLTSFENPENGEKCKFLFVKGVKFSGSPKELFAVTNVKIMGSYWAVFDDGHVQEITDKDFENHKEVLGLNKSAEGNLVRPQINNQRQ